MFALHLVLKKATTSVVYALQIALPFVRFSGLLIFVQQNAFRHKTSRLHVLFNKSSSRIKEVLKFVEKKCILLEYNG